jgi:hypothetical protein
LKEFVDSTGDDFPDLRKLARRLSAAVSPLVSLGIDPAVFSFLSKSSAVIEVLVRRLLELYGINPDF